MGKSKIGIHKIKCYYSAVSCVDCPHACGIWDKFNDLNDVIQKNLEVKKNE